MQRQQQHFNFANKKMSFWDEQSIVHHWFRLLDLAEKEQLDQCVLEICHLWLGTSRYHLTNRLEWSKEQFFEELQQRLCKHSTGLFLYCESLCNLKNLSQNVQCEWPDWSRDNRDNLEEQIVWQNNLENVLFCYKGTTSDFQSMIANKWDTVQEHNLAMANNVGILVE